MTVISEITPDASLRLAIRVDGIVVALLGLAMVVSAGLHSTITGLPTPVEYGAGVFSIAYGPLAFWLAARKQVRATGLVVAAINALTTVGLVVLVATELVGLTATGNVLALLVGAYTAAIGGWQCLSARRLA